MRFTGTIERTARVAALVCATLLGACSLTLESVHRVDVAGGTGDGTTRDVPNPRDDGADVPQPMDAPDPNDVADGNGGSDASDGDSGMCAEDPQCGAGMLCCPATHRCYPAACLACCMFAIDVPTVDGRPDANSDVPFDIPRDVPIDVVRDALIDAPFDARPDVAVDIPTAVEAGRTDVTIIVLDEGPLCGACPAGTICCDGACSNTDFDENNCGGCGVVCASTQACVFGACQACVSSETLCTLATDRCCLPLGMFCTFRCPTGR